MRILPLSLFILCSFILTFGQTVNLIDDAQPFQSNATTKLEPLRATERFRKIERGTLNGVQYWFAYSDGEGRFSGTKEKTLDDQEGEYWQTACMKDSMSDAKSCWMRFRDLWIFNNASSGFTVYVGRNHYPGSSIAIRIDDGTPIMKTISDTNGGDDGRAFSRDVSLKIISQLNKAKKVTTRFQKWPNSYDSDDTWEVYGFNEALLYLKWAVAHIK